MTRRKRERGRAEEEEVGDINYATIQCIYAQDVHSRIRSFSLFLSFYDPTFAAAARPSTPSPAVDQNDTRT